MVNFLEGLYAVTVLLFLAAVVFLVRRRRGIALWLLFTAFVAGLSAALLYVKHAPKKVAGQSGTAFTAKDAKGR